MLPLVAMYIITLIGIDKKLEVFTAYYYRLTHINFVALHPHLVTAKIINHEDSQIIQHTVESSKVAFHILEKILNSLRAGIGDVFDEFLLILEKCDEIVCIRLAEHIRKDLLNSRNGTVCTHSNSALWVIINVF